MFAVVVKDAHHVHHDCETQGQGVEELVAVELGIVRLGQWAGIIRAVWGRALVVGLGFRCDTGQGDASSAGHLRQLSKWGWDNPPN